MSIEAHHGRALIEEARSALDGAHRAALAADAGGLRRSLATAETLLHDASRAGLGEEADADIAAVRGGVAKALADLEAGALVEMELLVEASRTRLAKT